MSEDELREAVDAALMSEMESRWVAPLIISFGGMFIIGIVVGGYKLVQLIASALH